VIPRPRCSAACLRRLLHADKEAAKRIIMRDTAYFDTQVPQRAPAAAAHLMPPLQVFYKQLKGGMYKEALWFKRQARATSSFSNNRICSALRSYYIICFSVCLGG
jgi:hypothetical protein